MTHVEIPTELETFITKTKLYNDGIGYTESWDFSRANLSKETRIATITKVASICYGNEKSIGSISLYDRLACESIGLPSSSFEFVPILIHKSIYHDKFIFGTIGNIQTQVSRYGEWVENGTYLLSNLRALIADKGTKADEFYNTEEECNIIAKHFKVFKWKIPIFTARQAIRHRVTWQELSRRYVSGKRIELEFYHSDKMHDSLAVIPLCVTVYNQAIADGIKPEDARQVLPLSLYTTIWSAWLPQQLNNFYKLRLDSHSQYEIRELAKAMKGNDNE